MQKLAEICVRRPVFATMLITTLIVLGVFSYNRLTVERFPKVEFPVVTIITRLPGAAAQEVESEITDKIEEAVNTISGIEDLNSTSSEGVSLVFVNFDLDRNLDTAAQDVRDKINRVLPLLPKNVEIPTIEKLDPDASPIMTVSISSNHSVREMTDYADKVLRRQIESVNGVGQVQIIGGRKRQININLDGDKLRAYNLTVAQVSQALQAQNLEVPGGRIEQQKQTLTLRTLGRLQNPKDFNNLIVSTRNGYPIKISDIGSMEDGVEQEVSAGFYNDKPTLLLQIRRQSGTNTVNVIDGLKVELEKVKKSMPPGYDLNIVRDQAVFILAAFHTVREHLVLGSLLAALVVFLFMQNLRATIIAAVAIPSSIIATFAMMEWAGITLNGMSMLGLTLAVGIVIDDAIVVLENIFRYIEEKGYEPFEAAIAATKEIGMAVMATTLSLIVIFLPVAFMPSIAGRFFKSAALTMTFSIAVSLLVSFTLTPMMSARMLKRVPASKHEGEKNSWMMRMLDRGYSGLLQFSLHHRWLICLIALIVFISTVPLFQAVGKDFFPEDDQSEFEMTIRTAEGMSLQTTAEIINRITTEVRKLPSIEYTLTTIGADQQANSNVATVYVKLAPLETRSKSQFNIMQQVRDKVIPKFKALNLRSSVQTIAAIGGSSNQNANFSFMILGPDLDRLREYSDKLLARLKNTPGIVDPDSSLVFGKPEVRAVIDRQKAADLGVNVSDVAQSLRLLVGGDKVSTYNEGGEQYEVHIRANENYRTDTAGIKQLNVPSSRLGSVGLENMVHFEPATGPTQIERAARQRRVLLTANLKEGVSQSQVKETFLKDVKDLNMQPGYSVIEFGRIKEQTRTGKGFALAFLLSFIFMYIVLAAQFESFLHPITVLMAIPLSVPFAMFSLLVTGQSLNMFTLLGLLVLFGMVKKNSILQIDHTNGLRAKGMERHLALVQASRDRLRPILMTTLAFVAGMAPLALSNGPGSGINRSTSVVVIGGQSLCLLLTLLMTPVVYSIFDDWINSTLWRRLTGKVGGAKRKLVAGASALLGLIGK